MSKPELSKTAKDSADFIRKVGAQEARKLRSKRRPMRSIWMGFGMFGLIGWSVVIPTLLGTLLGMWLDKKYVGSRSWTLALLVTGLILGCMNAWRWLAKEERAMREEEQQGDEHKPDS